MKNPLKNLFNGDKKDEKETDPQPIESVCEDASGDLASFCDIELNK